MVSVTETGAGTSTGPPRDVPRGDLRPSHRDDAGLVDAVLTEPERLSPLDGPARLLTAVAGWEETRLPGLVRFLRGRWLGHPTHPGLATVPLGMAVAATVADLTRWTRPAVRPLLAVGALAAVPAAASGLADLPAVGREGERVAVVHVTANGLGLLLQGSAMLAPFPLSRRLLRAGLLASSVAAAYGGHLAFRNRAHVRP